jgi:uncharacterized membrane protein YhiD involved in acid resistance
MAGIGLAIGSGYYAPAVGTTLILLGILWVLRILERRLSKPLRFVHFEVGSRREAGVLDEINEIAESHGLQLGHFRLSRDEERMEVEFALTCTTEARDALVERMLEIDAVEMVHVNE